MPHGFGSLYFILNAFWQSKTKWVTISSQSLIPEPQNDKDQAKQAWWQSNQIESFSARKYGCLHDVQSFDKQSKYVKYICQKCLQMTPRGRYIWKIHLILITNQLVNEPNSHSVDLTQWKYKHLFSWGIERLQTTEVSLSMFNIKRFHFISNEKKKFSYCKNK